MTTGNSEAVLSLGEAIRQKLDERGWTQYDLAAILGVNQSAVSTVINGKSPLKLDLARGLAAAFHTEPGYWITLDTEYRLFSEPADDGVAHRTRLFEAAPVVDMIKRRWIQDTSDAQLLEKQILAFYGVSSLDEVVADCAHAARKSSSYAEVKPAERAWIQRVRRLGPLVSANKFSDSGFERAMRELTRYLGHAENVRHVPTILAEAGIRFVVVEPLGRTRIDGVCVWLDKTSPVIGVSLRIERLDSFWFTLFHELGHVKNRDGLLTQPVVDSDLIGEDATHTHEKPEPEQKADEFASSALISPAEIHNFIARIAPLFSKTRIQGFASRIAVHPAIVIGQLHHLGCIPWSYGNKDFLVKVREIVTGTTLTDGWGQTLPAIS